MAISQQQKVDFLLKKIGYTKTKTGLAVDSSLSGTKKAGFAEVLKEKETPKAKEEDKVLDFEDLKP